jgi:hypothetical protein
VDKRDIAFDELDEFGKTLWTEDGPVPKLKEYSFMQGQVFPFSGLKDSKSLKQKLFELRYMPNKM